ncbi:MAG: hypothetical protein HFF04_03115 [Oscillospiraceae bacterium]|nr:hypothetical protein [Oscillospiraceae bacterium]
MEFQQNKPNRDTLTRLAVCVVIGVAAVYAAEKLCEGKHFPLWEKYGPWVQQNKVQAIAVIAAVLYGASLALWPEGLPGSTAPKDDGFEPC